MRTETRENKLGLNERKRVFVALVEAQDSGQTPEGSRKATGEKFAISENAVRLIEEEGLAEEWPPL